MWNEAYASDLPIAASDVAAQWDLLYRFELWLSVFFFVLVVGAMVYFAYKYRRGATAKTKYITGSHLLEALWSIIPAVLLLVIFGWGYVVYNSMTQAPSEAYEVRVIGKQWLWEFYYPDGKKTTNEVYVPVNKPVKFIMTSTDVLHSFFVPNFRIKQDVVPGMYTSVWFEASIAGKHQVYCTEYCGASHSMMLAQVIALDDEQWDLWTRGKKLGAIPNASDNLKTSAASTETKLTRQAVAADAGSRGLAEQGKTLAEAKGCIACHSADGSKKIGPSFKGVFGHSVELVDGSKVRIDENYIRESIVNPQAKVVKGYNPVMPTFQGLLSEPEMGAVIAYIKSLK